MRGTVYYFQCSYILLRRILDVPPKIHRQVRLVEMINCHLKSIMKTLVICSIPLFLTFSPTLKATDNRRPQPVTSFDYVVLPLPDEVQLLRIIENDKGDPALAAAVKGGAMRLKWNQQVSLIDKNYNLAVFVPEYELNPGSNPIVLILLSLDNEIKTWKQFDATPMFQSGCIASPSFDRPETYFLTLSTNDFSGQGTGVYLQKYSLSPQGISLAGGGYLDLGKLK